MSQTDDIEIVEGSSINLTFRVKVSNVLNQPDYFTVETTSPDGVETTYTFDGIDGSIVNTADGVFVFVSNPTDEVGIWTVLATAAWDVAGRVPTNDLTQSVKVSVEYP